MKIIILTTFLLTIFFSSYYSQCVANGGLSGNIYDYCKNDSIAFNVTMSSTCYYTNNGYFTGCGITFPSIWAPFSGITDDSISTITYTFSESICSIDILIGYTSVDGLMRPETFVFTTNSSTPTVAVNSGTCIPWTIVNNQTTSPSIIGALNSIHTVSSSTPFTSVSIVTNSSSNGPMSNGGSSFALCEGSVRKCGALRVNLGKDDTLCLGDSILLDATVPNGTYLWQDSSTLAKYLVKEQGKYWVTVTDNCISFTDSIQINYKECKIVLKLPNVFTPNGDGTNDLFSPVETSRISKMTTIIYNRWGDIMFETENLLINWDGGEANEGVYFWVINYIDINNQHNSLKGYLTLFR